MSLGKNLREYRKLKGLTQKELANLIGVKHNSISNWENDQNKPDPDTIELICGALDISPNDLILKGSKFEKFIGDAPVTDCLFAELKECYDQLSSSRKRFLVAAARGMLAEQAAKNESPDASAI